MDREEEMNKLKEHTSPTKERERRSWKIKKAEGKVVLLPPPLTIALHPDPVAKRDIIEKK